MENATKALIIAGAVLIAILLISIGILLINNNKGITDSATATSNQLSSTAASKSNLITNQLTNL